MLTSRTGSFSRHDVLAGPKVSMATHASDAYELLHSFA